MCGSIGWRSRKRRRRICTCPHGVQFFDVVVEGQRHARAAWRYEAPLPSMRHVADRFGFWDEVEVG